MPPKKTAAPKTKAAPKPKPAPKPKATPKTKAAAKAKDVSAPHASQATKKTTTKIGEKKSLHPPYKTMAATAIRAMKNGKGSSPLAIRNYIIANFHVDPGFHLRIALKNGVEKGVFDKQGGVYKLGKKAEGLGKRSGVDEKKAKTTKKKPASAKGKKSTKKTTSVKAKTAKPKAAGAKKSSKKKVATKKAAASKKN